MKHDNDIVIVAAVRTAIARFGGALKEVKASRLAAHVIKDVLVRANNLDPVLLDEIIFGDCIQSFDEANTARTAALMAGIPFEVPAYTVQRQCSSSMQALASGVHAIQSGNADIVMVGGVESMSSAPYYMADARWGMRLQNHEATDAVWEMLHSGSRILGDPMIMGITVKTLRPNTGSPVRTRTSWRCKATPKPKPPSRPVGSRRKSFLLACRAKKGNRTCSNRTNTPGSD